MIEFTKGQTKAIKKGLSWYKKQDKQFFKIAGLAGTGKSTIVNALIHYLGLQQHEVLFMTYVGKATLALRKNGLRAKTCHSSCYDVIQTYELNPDGTPVKLDNGKFKRYVLINPKIISKSEEMIYVGEGEGCLSVNRPVEGIVPRHARLRVEAYDVDGNKFQIRVREDIAVAFQHELDHLNGILFVDKIDPKNPYKNMEHMREI